MKYERKMMSIDLFIEFLDGMIADGNENEEPPRSPLDTTPSYGLCGKLGTTAAYRMREFITQMPSILCYLCNTPIDGAPLVDFYFYIGTEGDLSVMLPPNGILDNLCGTFCDLNATYLLVFACEKCWNKTVAYRDKLTSYAEHAFLPKTKYARKAGVTAAVINSKGREACQGELMDAVDGGTMEIEQLNHLQLIQISFTKGLK
jgi:hypothetical protein